MLDKGLTVWLSLFMLAIPLSLGLTSTLFFPLLAFWFLGATYTFAHWPPTVGRLEKYWVVFIVLSANAAVFGLSPAHSFKSIWNKDFYFLVYALLAATVGRGDHRDRLVLLFWWASVVAAALGIVQWLLAVGMAGDPDGFLAHAMASAPKGVHHILDQWSGRSPGPRSHPIRYSEDLLFAVALSIAFLGRDVERRWLWLIGAWVLCLAILFSQTRGTWFATGVVMAVGLWLDRRRFTRYHALLVAVPLVLLVMAAGLRTRFESSWSREQGSNTERIQMWHAGWHVIKHHPIWGTGPGTIPLSTRADQPPSIVAEGGWGHLHNTYISIATDRGLLGLAAFLVLMGGFAFALRKHFLSATSPMEQGLIRGAQLGWLGFLLCGLTEMDYNNADVAITFYAVMGLALSRTLPKRPS